MTLDERLQNIDEAYWRGTGMSAFLEIIGRHIRAAETAARAEGRLAGLGEAAGICELYADELPPHNETRRLVASNLAHQICVLIAEDAPKEPSK